MKRIILSCLAVIMLLTGCFPIHRNSSHIDDSLSGIADYIVKNTDYDIILSAYDERNGERNDICLKIIVKTANTDEQYEIINSVIESVDEYLLSDTDIDGNTQLITLSFQLPIDRYSGEPGDYLCEINNLSEDDCYEDELVRIRPFSYGRSYDYENQIGAYEIPDNEFTGIYIMSAYYCSNEEVEEYISSWESIDTVYVSTTEQATELQPIYPNITFIGYNRESVG